MRLSPSTLGDYQRCPRCFWLAKNAKLEQPRGIFPSLPGGMDKVIKKHWDDCRRAGKLPMEIASMDGEHKLRGQLFADQATVNRWRNWRTGLCADLGNGLEVIGALDDCLVDGDLHYVIDAKTRGWPPKPGDTEKYYQTQADCYALMLESSGRKVGGEAYFVYYWPEGIYQNEGRTDFDTAFRFNVEVVTIEVDPTRAKDVARAAAVCLAGNKPAAQAASCEMCNYVDARAARAEQKDAGA